MSSSQQRACGGASSTQLVPQLIYEGDTSFFFLPALQSFVTTVFNCTWGIKWRSHGWHPKGGCAVLMQSCQTDHGVTVALWKDNLHLASTDTGTNEDALWPSIRWSYPGSYPTCPGSWRHTCQTRCFHAVSFFAHSGMPACASPTRLLSCGKHKVLQEVWPPNKWILIWRRAFFSNTDWEM